MSKAIATIRLAPGRVGFYDPISRIHLTLAAPEKTVYAGTNCSELRRNVRAGVLRLISGSLGEDVHPFKVVKVDGKYKLAPNITVAKDEKEPTVVPPQKKVEEPKEETPVEKTVVTDIPVEAKVAEETSTEEETPVVENAKEQETSQDAPKKTATKRATAKKTTTKKAEEK